MTNNPEAVRQEAHDLGKHTGAQGAGETHLKRVLGLPALVLFGLAYMVPLTVFSTLGPVAKITDNHVPGSYVITLLVMMFTAISYGFMSRKFPVAGSAYVYSQRTFGGHAGFLTGWALLLDYILLPMINYMLLGLYLNAYFPAIPAWVFLLVAVVIVAALNIAGIASVARVNMILVAVQAVFCVVFIALSLRTASGVPSTPSVLDSVFGGNVEMAAVFTGAAILCLSFLGFDAVSTLSEEAREPHRDVPRAILAVTVIGGLTFIVLSAVSYLVIPDWRTFDNVDTAAQDVVLAAGGHFLSNFFVAAYISGAMGSAIASQASVSRILYSMGRDEVLPRRLFGVLSHRTSAPVRAILVVALVSLLGIVLPLEFVISIISFGALAAFTMVNLSVVKSHVFDDRRRSPLQLVKYAVVPGIGFLLTVWLWTSLPHNAIVLGLVWLAVGVAELAVITRGFRRKPPQMDLEEIV